MADKIKLTPPSRALLALEARALVELGWFWQSLGVLRTVARGDGHPVMVLPGFTATDISTAPFAGIYAIAAMRPMAGAWDVTSAFAKESSSE
jgi:hypothetical protein